MEGADWPLRIFLQVVEERRFVSVLDTLENGQMQFQKLFHRVEETTQ